MGPADSRSVPAIEPFGKVERPSGRDVRWTAEHFPPPEGAYKCASVYKPIKSRLSCITSVYISVYASVFRSGKFLSREGAHRIFLKHRLIEQEVSEGTEKKAEG